MMQVRMADEGPVRTLAIDRAAALNALTNAVLAELAQALEDAATAADVRVVVLTGEGGKAFSAGIDLAERSGLDDAGKAAQSRAVLDLVRALVALPKPVVASIGGWCLGAGLEIALACDIRIAGEGARFAFPEMGLGAYPGGGGAVLLPRIVGPARAADWLLAPRRLDASQARDLGLVTRIAPDADLAEATRALALEVAKLAPLATAALKQSLGRTADLALGEAFEADQALRRPLDATRDYQEGLRAARDKRPAQFTGA